LEHGDPMMDRNLLEKVLFPEGVSHMGVYANAFRLTDDGAGEMFLDFMVYSGQEEEAEMVSRVRVRQDFIQSILEHLSSFVEAERDSSGIFRLISGPDVN
jgi:hypothetical protein